MILKEQIKKGYVDAMRSKDTVAKNLLSVIKGDIQNVEKASKVDELSDEEVIKILNKSAKTLREVINQTGDQESKEQLTIVEAYLPKQMTRDEISAKVNELMESGVTNLGGVMKAFGSLPADRKVVQEVVKELIG